MIISNQAGLSFEFLKNGSVKSIQVDPVRISLKAATPWSVAGCNLYLRKRNNPIEFTALLGPESNSSFYINNNVFATAGTWNGIRYECSLHLAANSLSWQWQTDIQNTSGETVELDLIHVQDIGLKQINDGLVNEYYVAQYLERRIIRDSRYGAVICCRQNMKEPTGNPWLMLACRQSAIAGSTDGIQFYGKSCRETGIPEGLLADVLTGNCAGESPVVALQEKPFVLAENEKHRNAFTCLYNPDHPAATSADDLLLLPSLFSAFEKTESIPGNAEPITPTTNIFNTAGFLPVDDLCEKELEEFFGSERRYSEMSGNQLLSFFYGDHNHVMLRVKELLTDRPHAHIMQANTGFTPDEHIMSTTAFAFGVFNSHISQGNTNFNVLLSVCTSPFNTSRESGQRIFVELDGTHYLLGVPSAFEMGLNFCRWIYKHGDILFQVRTWTTPDKPLINLDFKVLSGMPASLLITHDFDALNGWKVFPAEHSHEFVIKPGRESMIRQQFHEAQFRMVVNNPCDFTTHGDDILYPQQEHQSAQLFVIKANKISNFCMTIIGETLSAALHTTSGSADECFTADIAKAGAYWKKLSQGLSLQSTQDDISAISEILPWYGMNAMTHYLTPYGLEQFSGAAWGTRDVSQGPVELLLTMGKEAEAREVLLIIFSNQNPDGGWPQWWMFDRYARIRASDSHGDVFYWVIIALGSYVKATGDTSILDVVVPYFNGNNQPVEKTPVSEHIDRLIRMITGSFIPGTSLVPFGGGDWNDSLQPVNEELAKRMISSWTVEMNYQAFRQYAQVYDLTDKAKADELREICNKIRIDFNKYLIRDGIVAGYGLVEPDGKIDVMLHPGDNVTGVHYSLLPMERGILSGIFTAEQAEFHLNLIEQHLKGPDGARLMDRPLRYKGGIQEIFQRAESSTFFGREIGLMYVHEHIRYAEAQALTGRAEAFIKALRQAIPVSYRDVVPCGDVRQSNCYYSSSDVTFETRYDADEYYDEVLSGKHTLRGGWRVYSSGPGIYTGLVVTRLLGIRVESGHVILDPVMPESFDGLAASLEFKGRNVSFQYSVKQGTFSPVEVKVNGETIAFSYEENPYRRGGAKIDGEKFLSLLNLEKNVVEVRL